MSEVNKTFINDINLPDKPSEIQIIDHDSLSEHILDLSIDEPTRIKYLEMLYKDLGPEPTIEIIKRLSMMFTLSGTKMIEQYLYSICIHSNLNPELKIICATSLCFFNEEKENGYDALNHICQDMPNVPTPCRIEAVRVLMKHKKYKLQSRNYFCDIINDLKIECDYRYKSILSLENTKIINKNYFLKESCLEFFNNTENRTLYRILAGQYLIQKCELKDTNDIQVGLMSFAQDPDLDYDLRADAADVILRIGSPKNKITAKEIILMLGRQDGYIKTIFNNAQNVHVNEIEDSVLEVLEFLSSLKIKSIQNIPITFEYVKKQIDNLLKLEKHKCKKKCKKDCKYNQKLDSINISLNRIYMDRALYGKYNINLLHILLKIWTYLSSHKSELQMKQRLLEELVDMSGTCSTGFASRLVNVISGFGDFNLRISWRDQIIANFTGRLNACARDIKDEDFQALVLEEMTVASNLYEDRMNFLQFFRKNMLKIRQELYGEFKEHITDEEFDTFFRSAIETYETGSHV